MKKNIVKKILVLTVVFGVIAMLSSMTVGAATLENVALNKTATASSSYDADTMPPSAAFDGDDTTVWASNASSIGPWVQIDLGEAYVLKRVELQHRTDEIDQEAIRRYHDIQASNDPEFGTFVTLASQGEEVLPLGHNWVNEVTDTTAYRYVRVEQNPDEGFGHFVIAEIRVFAEVEGANSDDSSDTTSDDNTTTPGDAGIVSMVVLSISSLAAIALKKK